MESQTGAVTEGFFTLAALIGFPFRVNAMWGAGRHSKADFPTVATAGGSVSFVQRIVIVVGNATQNVNIQG